jgi:N-acetyl sugar amidotransferase
MNNYLKKIRDLKTIDPEKEIVFCKNCTMSNQRPRIQFNEKGICSACVYNEYKNKIIDWDKREKELEILCDKHRKEDGTWDVIVPSSGGKGNGFILNILKEKFGMHPLTVTFSPAIPTEIGYQNLCNMSYFGFDNLRFTTNGHIHKKLSKISLKDLGHCFLPFAYGQMNIPLQVSVKFNIPFIMFGENGDLETGGNLAKLDIPTLEISPMTSDTKISGLPKPTATSELSYENWLPDGVKIEDLKLYLPPPTTKIKKVGVEEHYFSYYYNWKPEEHYEIAKKYCGYQQNSVRIEGTHTNQSGLDDKFLGFHYYFMFIKQGMGRATLDTSRQIRQGIITRDEGVELVRKYDGEFPSKYLDLFLDYMEMDMDELNRIFDKFRKPIVWKKDNEKWELRQQISKL